jgi:glutathione synthase
MLLAAQARGWSLFYMEQRDLYQGEGKARARMRPLKVFADPARWFELGDEQDSLLSELDVILMRKDPPFDMEFVYSTYLLEQAEPTACWWSTARRACATATRSCSPRCSRSARRRPWSAAARTSARIRRQARRRDPQAAGRHGRHVDLPPPRGDPNLSVILETLTALGTQQIMAQAYLPAIKDGDKRILMIDGEPVDYCLARIPASGETRGNLAAGGRGEARPLTERDRWIAAQVGPTLREKGLLFVGLDVIGDTSPKSTSPARPASARSTPPSTPISAAS